MNNLVYFPTFEPPTSTWLKFALLYVENFNPIIPLSGRAHLTDDYKRIIDQSDLISPYMPRYDQGDRASIKAVEFVERIDRHPDWYSSLFRRANIATVIRNPELRNFKIYEEKFSLTWENYCLENGFGERTEGGINVSEELAFLYMSFLAEEIAYDEGKSIITDNHRFDNFLSHRRVIPRRDFTKNSFAQGVLGLLVPRNISEIPIQTLLEFRNRNRKKIQAFNIELDNALNNVEAGITEAEFVDRFNSIYSELNSEIIAQGAGVTTVPLATYILIQNPIVTSTEYLSQIIGGLGIILTAKIGISSRWIEISNRHQCKRYLTNLERLR